MGLTKEIEDGVLIMKDTDFRINIDAFTGEVLDIMSMGQTITQLRTSVSLSRTAYNKFILEEQVKEFGK